MPRRDATTQGGKPIGKGFLGRAQDVLGLGPGGLGPPIRAELRAITFLLAVPDRQDRMARIVILLLGILTVLATLEFASGFLEPTALAVVLAFLVMPVARTLEYLPFGRYFAAATAVLILLGSLVLGLLLALPAIEGWVARLPEVTQALEREIDAVRSTIATMESASKEVQESVSLDAAGEPAQQTVIVEQDGVFSRAAVLAPAFLAQVVYVGFLVVFLVAERGCIRAIILRAPASFVTRLKLARVVRDMRSIVTGYLFTISCINLGMAAISTATLVTLGIPDALLWGVGVGVLNFIPYIGPLAIQTVIFLVGLLTFGTLEAAVVAPAILLVVHVVESNIVTPMLVGRRVVFSPLAIFAAVAFGAWLWGVGGAVVAVPLLIILWTMLRGLYEIQLVTPPHSTPQAGSPTGSLDVITTSASERAGPDSI